MEPLRLLQFWHIPSNKNTAAIGDSDTDITSSPSETTTTTATTIDHHSIDTDDEDSFFDLNFPVPLRKKPEDYNPNNKVVLPKPRSPPRLRLHMLLKDCEESEEKTEASKGVPIFSLLYRRNSPAGMFQKQRPGNASSARRLPRVVIQKYLKLINPFRPRASRKACAQTAKTTNEVSKRTTPFSSPRKQVAEKQGICAASENLGKSRSASASGVRSVATRRDDSLLLQHDGIQSAILHCKRSYNSSTEFCVLSRSASGRGPSVIPSRNSTEEVKTRTSI